MISINLLPEEFRRRERTSIKVFATILGAVVVICCSLGYFGHVYFNELKSIESQRACRSEENLKNVEPLAKYDDQLVEEKKEYKSRSDQIQKIANSRVLWTKMLDQFIDIVNNEGSMERHMVWFKNLSVRDSAGRSGPRMTLAALSQSKSFKNQANFLDDVQKNPEFFDDFMAITAPGGRVVPNDNRIPSRAVSFKLEMTMKHSESLGTQQEEVGGHHGTTERKTAHARDRRRRSCPCGRRLWRRVLGTRMH